MDDILNDDRRVISLTAVHNFRDLGGYPTQDGRRTKWRRLFRADGLHRLTTEDLEIVRQLGLQTVVDLRTVKEVETRGTFPRNRIDVTFHHVPIIDATWGETTTPTTDDPVEFLVWAYRDMLSTAADRFADAFTRLSSAAALPAVFHCAAGKDRTGVLAALLLGALGVDTHIITADYALTREAMRRLLDWARNHQPDLAAAYDRLPARSVAADPLAMEVIMRDLETSHGSVRNYVRSIGVDEATLDSLSNQLLV